MLVVPPTHGATSFMPSSTTRNSSLASKRNLRGSNRDVTHQGKVAIRHRTWRIVDAATAEAEKLRLARDGEFVLAVDHFFPPSNPALPSAPDKKSFSSVSSPILACSVLTSTVGPAGS